MKYSVYLQATSFMIIMQYMLDLVTALCAGHINAGVR